MNWVNAHIGLPEAHCHCWELIRRVYRSELRIELPSYDGTVATDAERREVQRLVAGEEIGGTWRQLDIEARAEPLDVLVFRRGGLRSHVGLAIDNHRMLHMKTQACVERFRRTPWGDRLAGIYRHLQSPFEGGAK